MLLIGIQVNMTPLCRRLCIVTSLHQSWTGFYYFIHCCCTLLHLLLLQTVKQADLLRRSVFIKFQTPSENFSFMPDWIKNQRRTRAFSFPSVCSQKNSRWSSYFLIPADQRGDLCSWSVPPVGHLGKMKTGSVPAGHRHMLLKLKMKVYSVRQSCSF